MSARIHGGYGVYVSRVMAYASFRALDPLAASHRACPPVWHVGQSELDHASHGYRWGGLVAGSVELRFHGQDAGSVPGVQSRNFSRTGHRSPAANRRTGSFLDDRRDDGYEDGVGHDTG